MEPHHLIGHCLRFCCSIMPSDKVHRRQTPWRPPPLLLLLSHGPFQQLTRIDLGCVASGFRGTSPLHRVRLHFVAGIIWECEMLDSLSTYATSLSPVRTTRGDKIRKACPSQHSRDDFQGYYLRPPAQVSFHVRATLKGGAGERSAQGVQGQTRGRHSPRITPEPVDRCACLQRLLFSSSSHRLGFEQLSSQRC